MPAGRPKKWDPDMLRQAEYACRRLGATDADLAALFGVSESTLNRWKHDQPEFWDSITRAKEEYDSDQIEASLRKKCLGYTYRETTYERDPVSGNRVVAKVTVKHQTADTAGIRFWLKNRRPERWPDKIVMDLNEHERALKEMDEGE